MPEVWVSLLDRPGASKDKYFRRKPAGIPVPTGGLRRNSGMGGEAMRITVVGAILIIAAALAALLVVRALVEKRNRGPQQNEAQ